MYEDFENCLGFSIRDKNLKRGFRVYLVDAGFFFMLFRGWGSFIV